MRPWGSSQKHKNKTWYFHTPKQVWRWITSFLNIIHPHFLVSWYCMRYLVFLTTYIEDSCEPWVYSITATEYPTNGVLTGVDPIFPVAWNGTIFTRDAFITQIWQRPGKWKKKLMWVKHFWIVGKSLSKYQKWQDKNQIPKKNLEESQ